MPSPYVFIGSSSEGLPYARAIQAELERVAECQIWSQQFFGVGDNTLDRIIDSLEIFDFAILVATGEDIGESRGQSANAPRDKSAKS